MHATLTAAAAPDRTVAAGAAGVVVMSVQIASESGDAELDALTVSASGSGNDTDIAAVNVYVDVNEDGAVDDGDELIGSGEFATDDGTAEYAVALTAVDIDRAADQQDIPLDGLPVEGATLTVD